MALHGDLVGWKWGISKMMHVITGSVFRGTEQSYNIGRSVDLYDVYA